MEDKDWFWQDDSYRLDAESPLAISRSLWDGLAQSEADSRSLFASTPTTDILGSDNLASNLASNLRDLDVSKNVDAPEAIREGSPRAKRRRMLLFPGSSTECAMSDPCFEPFLEPIYGSQSAASIPGCEDYARHEANIATSSNPLWYLRNDDVHFSLDEVLEPASPKWITRPFDDCHGNDPYDPTKLIVPGNRIQLTGNEMQLPGNEISVTCSDFQQPQSQEVEVTENPSTTFTRSPSDKKSITDIARPKSGTPVAYPFALLKPCGAQGDVTLSDINQRISMPPTRPPPPHSGCDDTRSSSGSSIISPAGSPGLSGKSVVALTKIHTEGNGTITIMRTRG